MSCSGLVFTPFFMSDDVILDSSCERRANSNLPYQETHSSIDKQTPARKIAKDNRLVLL